MTSYFLFNLNLNQIRGLITLDIFIIVSKYIISLSLNQYFPQIIEFNHYHDIVRQILHIMLEKCYYPCLFV